MPVSSAKRCSAIVPYDKNDSASGYAEIAPAPDATQGEPIDESIWYDKDGNEITEEEARRETLVDKNGNVVCEYIRWNDYVARIEYSAKDDTLLPITVVTQSDSRVGRARHDAINMIYCVLYPLELAAIFLIYFKKRTK